MDLEKRARLLEYLETQPEPQVVPIKDFFDGNDDLGSIGCNLSEHPGIERFREILTGLEERDDVDGVYAQVAEVDAGEDCWPFADVILVAGDISIDALRELLAPLQPDEIGAGTEFGTPPEILVALEGKVLAAWWD